MKQNKLKTTHKVLLGILFFCSLISIIISVRVLFYNTNIDINNTSSETEETVDETVIDEENDQYQIPLMN